MISKNTFDHWCEIWYDTMPRSSMKRGAAFLISCIDVDASRGVYLDYEYFLTTLGNIFYRGLSLWVTGHEYFCMTALKRLFSAIWHLASVEFWLFTMFWPGLRWRQNCWSSTQWWGEGANSPLWRNTTRWVQNFFLQINSLCTDIFTVKKVNFKYLHIFVRDITT